MTKKHLIPYLLLPVFAAPAAQAEIDLIAIGEVNANYQDLSAKTATPLENGVAGNPPGGVGSGLAYAGIANPNKLFVFTVDGSDLPNYVPQQITP